MKNIEFANGKIKKEYKNLLANYVALPGIMIYEFEFKDQEIKIEDIVHNLHDTRIIVNNGDKLITVIIDLLQNKIKVNDETWPYTKIFDNHSKKFIIPIGYEYQKNGRVIFRKHIIKLNVKYGNNHVLFMKENDMKYSIDITSCKDDFKIEDFISKLLDHNETITNLRELLVIISKLIDLVYFDLKLSDDRGSLIKIHYNMLKDYVEYRDSENETKKIFLKNNEFMVERRIKEKYDDDITPLIKKIGVYNGKEKRKD